MSERAENMVLVKLKTGGEEEWTSVCTKHARMVGKGESRYELIGLPVLGVSEEFVQAKRKEQLQSAGTREQARIYDARMTGKKRFEKTGPKDAPRQFWD